MRISDWSSDVCSSDLRMPNLLARNPQHLARADLRYTNGFALTWGEEQGLGIGDSGFGEGQRVLSAGAARIPRTPWSARFPAFPNSQSPIPHPGPQTSTPQATRHSTTTPPSAPPTRRHWSAQTPPATPP